MPFTNFEACCLKFSRHLCPAKYSCHIFASRRAKSHTLVLKGGPADVAGQARRAVGVRMILRPSPGQGIVAGAQRQLVRIS